MVDIQLLEKNKATGEECVVDEEVFASSTDCNSDAKAEEGDVSMRGINIDKMFSEIICNSFLSSNHAAESETIKTKSLKSKFADCKGSSGAAKSDKSRRGVLKEIAKVKKNALAKNKKFVIKLRQAVNSADNDFWCTCMAKGYLKKIAK